jgi:hypothetical protein
LHVAEFLDIPTIGIYTTNWQHLSRKYLDGYTKHVVLPDNKEDIALEHLLYRTWPSKRFQELCYSVVTSVSATQVITEIDRILAK